MADSTANWNEGVDYSVGGQPFTRIEWVARRLRDAILRGVLPAGEKIQPAQIAREWDISPTPLREAIQRLASEGLIEATPQRGARVARVSPQEAKELYELRILLDPIALHDSVSRFTDADRAAVAVAFEGYCQEWTGRDQVTYEMYDTHKRFHDATLRQCSSQRLLGIVSTLTQHCMRYTVWLAKRDRIAEHAEINDAIQRKDLEAATDAVARHSRPGLEWALSELARSDAEVPPIRPSLVVGARAAARALREVTTAPGGTIGAEFTPGGSTGD